MKTIIKSLLKEGLGLFESNIITPPQIPNTINFYHGGNLSEFNDIIAQKNGRYEYGPGLYLITKYDVALKYAKGNRKMYIVTVEKGIDINDAKLDTNKINEFVKSYIITTKRNLITNRLTKYINEGQIKAFVFNNIVLNEKAIKPSNTIKLRQFYIENGIDYEIINNAFGFGEDMMVLYNMKKIVNTIQIKSTDRLSTYEL